MSLTRRAALALDALALLLIAAIVRIARGGGFVADVLGVSISFRTPSRALLWLVIVACIRIALDRRTGLFGLPIGRLVRVGGADPFASGAAPGFSKRLAYASAGLAAALLLLLQEQLRNMYAVPDLGDPLFSIWRIGWVLHQLAADPANLFHANIFHPAPLTLTFSDPTMLNAVMSAPLLAAGAHPVVVYNALLFCAFWLSGIATYALVERITGSPRAAFVAGLIYATYAYRFDHYSHLELQMTHWMPLGLLALHRFLATGRWVFALALGLAGVLQLYSAMYYAVFFLVYVVAMALATAATRGLPVRRLWKPAAVAAVLACALSVPLARAFLAAQPQKGERLEAEVRYYSARPSDYLRANTNSAVWHGRLLPSEPERALFPGAAPLLLGALGAVPPLGALQAVYTAGLLVSVDASLGFNGASYPLLYRAFATVRGLRAPARFAALVGLSLAVLAGFGAARLLRRAATPARQHAVFAALIALVIADAWPSLSLRQVWRAPPEVYSAVRDRPGAVLAEFPVRDDEVFNLPYMYFSMSHWTPMVNGYSGFIPQSYLDVEPVLLAFPGGGSIAALRARGVTHVTINCGLRYPGCRDTQRQMAASPHLTLVAETEWQGAPVRLYELRGR